MADNSTNIQTNAQVNLTDNASTEAKKVAESFEAIGKAAEASAKKVSTLEDVLLLIEQKRRDGAISNEEATKQSNAIQTAIKNETEITKKHANAINEETKALNKRADAYKKKVNYEISPEGRKDKADTRKHNKDIDNAKTNRLNDRLADKEKERELTEDKLELKREQMKLKKSLSRYGTKALVTNSIKEISGKLADRGLAGRVTSDLGTIVASTITGGMPGLISSLITKATSGFIDFRDAVLEAYGSLEKIKTQMSVVFGGQVQSNSQFNNIAEYAVKSPFGIEGIAEYATLLKQSGIYSSDLLDTLKMIGDTAGGDAERMKRIANNYAQIVAVGKASMLDMRQFAYAGIPIYKEVAEYLKVSQAELRKMISDGEISAETIEAVFKRMTEKGGVFYQATQKGANTLTARKQNLEDTATLAKGQIGEYWINIGDTDTTGGLETFVLDFKEGFYEGLSDWGKRTNLVTNVEKLSKGSLQLANLKEERNRIANDNTLDETEKKQLLAYLDSQIAKYSNINSDNKISTYGQSQLLAEQQQANLFELEGLEKRHYTARNKLIAAVKEAKANKEPGISLIASDIGRELTYNNTPRIDSKLIEKWSKIEGSSPAIKKIREALTELGAVEAEFKKINSINGFYLTGSFSKSIIGILNTLALVPASAVDSLKNKRVDNWRQTGLLIGKSFATPATNTEVAPNNFETMFAAGSMYAMNGSNSLLDSIDKEQKKQNGSQTILSYFRQLEEATPEGQEKKQKEQEKFYTDIVNEAKKYEQLIKTLTLESGGIDKKEFNKLSTEQLVRLETNFIDENAKTFSGNAYDYVNELDAGSKFKPGKESEYLQLRRNMSLLSGYLLNNENLDKETKEALSSLKTVSSVGLTGADANIIQNMAESFDAYRKIEETMAEKLEKPELTSDEKTYYENLLKIIRSIFKEQKFNASEVANLNLDLLDSDKKQKNKGVNSLELQPLWKRIISSSTGLNVDMMNYDKASDILNNQWTEQLSRNLVSSAIVSIMKDGFQNASKDSELADAFEYLSFEGMKTLGAKSKGGNLNDEKNVNSETSVNSKSSPTLVNALGEPYKVAQINWKQTESNLYESLKKGVLSSATIDVFKTAYENQINSAYSLLEKALTTSENGEYVVGKSFNEAAVNAFSGFDIKDNETLTAEIKNAEGEFKKETLTWDSSAKKWKRANNEFVDSITEVRYSLDDLSEWIDAFIKANQEKSKIAGEQGVFQASYNAIKNSENTAAQKELSQLLYRKYITNNPGKTEDEYKYIQNQIQKKVEEEYSLTKSANGSTKTAAGLLKEFEENLKAIDSIYTEVVTNPLSGTINEKQVNLLSAQNSASENILQSEREAAVTSYMNEQLINSGKKQPNFANQLFNGTFGITGNNSYKDQQIIDGLGDEFKNQNWSDLKSSFGRKTLENIWTSRVTNDAWDNLNTNPFSENFSVDKTLFNNLKNQYSDLYEQAEGTGVDKDTNFLSSLADNTDVLDIIGDKFGQLNQLSKTWGESIDSIGASFDKLGMQFATNSIVEMSETIGENFGSWSDIMDSGADKMKELGKAALSNLSSLFVQAGLAYIANNPNWAGLGVGLAMIAAGGMAGIASGMLSATDNDDDDDQAAKLRQIKSDLADLLEQARNDATYYENELRHQNALSTNNNISQKTASVHDALISSNGNIITTDPKDYLIATKNPGELVGGGTFKPNIVFNVKNNSQTPVSSSYTAKQDDDGNIEITALIEEITSNFIASPKSDEVFNARQARLQGRDIVA